MKINFEHSFTLFLIGNTLINKTLLMQVATARTVKKDTAQTYFDNNTFKIKLSRDERFWL